MRSLALICGCSVLGCLACGIGAQEPPPPAAQPAPSKGAEATKPGAADAKPAPAGAGQEAPSAPPGALRSHLSSLYNRLIGQLRAVAPARGDVRPATACSGGTGTRSMGSRGAMPVPLRGNRVPAQNGEATARGGEGCQRHSLPTLSRGE